MNSCLTHRGPDDEGIYETSTIGLAHRRLSIIDPEMGQQPIYNEDETVVVIFNGEIYNYGSLKESLETAGHRFTTETDTEVLVHLYEEHGPSFVTHLEGMFAFALWDETSDRLVLARDQMGIKPLLVAETGDTVAFASELPALLNTDIDHGGLDRTAISEYFAFGFVPAPRTVFDNISKLLPGELAVIDAEGVQRERFYTPSVPSRTPDFEAAATDLRQHVEHAVERRLMSDVPLGAFLSGGIDSSIIAGTMSELLDDPVKTFTVGFNEDLFDESWAAREVAEYHDTDHTEFTVAPDDVREVIPSVLDQLGEPFADPSLLPTYVVARETSQDVKVALSGDGADELFAGYNKYRGEYYSDYYRAVPNSVRNRIIEPTINQLPASREHSAGELARKAQKFIRGSSDEISERHFAWMRIPDDRAYNSFRDIDPEQAGQVALMNQHNEVESILPAERRDSLSRIQAADTRYSLPNQMLTKVDLASMYNSLEVRVPFLDTDVVEYALSLPTDYKITPRSQKRILKYAFDDLLPEPILNRDKQGFDMPIGEWFKDELADEFKETVRCMDLDILDNDTVLDIFEDHATGRRDHSKFLWSVYVFGKWMQNMQRRNVLP